MKNKYSILKQLVELLEVFEEEKPLKNDLAGFVEWVAVHIKEAPEADKTIVSKKIFPDNSQPFPYIGKLNEKGRYLESIARIARLHEFYTRKYLSDLPINSRIEYLFLSTIEMLGKARKTDLINIHFIEYTTCMDTIRRLVNTGLLEEMADENDRRAKKLELTTKGREVLKLANSKINDERNMFLACFSPNKWKKTLAVLEEINEFHNEIYLAHNDKPAAELSNLIDSLKHLYK
ncbi:MAG: winged helix-turn-helix transcriptional regulator [Bacteroidales bacterium]|nr:winged helix-turn-helix transcriptional regulator [Bacteroidales bacterium]